MIRYHAEWVVPVSAPAVQDGTVVEEGGRIAYVGPRRGAPPGEDVELGQAILCPGLVNAHCHLELTAMRGFLEDMDFRDWILRLTTAKRAVLARDDLLDGARLGVTEGLCAGVTTYADTCDSGVAFDAMLELGVRGIMYQEVFGPDPAQCEASMRELIAKLDALRTRATSLVAVGVSPHAPYTVSDRLFTAVATYARAEGLPVAVHIAESAHECDLVERGAGVFAPGLRARGIDVGRRAASPVALLDATGMLHERTLLVHAVRTSEADVRLMQARRAPVAHCPVSNAKLGHGVAPLLAYLEAGLRVGLGSDSVASNNRMDLLGEAHVATLMQSAATHRADALGAAAALELATLGGARALGLDAEVGSLDCGKSADLAAFPILASARPVQRPEAALVHAMRGAQASLVAVAGQVRVRHGAVVGSDPHLAARVEAAAARLAAWLEHAAKSGGPVPPPSATR